MCNLKTFILFIYFYLVVLYITLNIKPVTFPSNLTSFKIMETTCLNTVTHELSTIPSHHQGFVDPSFVNHVLNCDSLILLISIYCFFLFDHKLTY